VLRHLVDLILDSERENPLFRAPCGDDKEARLHILDIGTGMGTWAMYVRPQYSPIKSPDEYANNFPEMSLTCSQIVGSSSKTFAHH